MFFRFTYHYVVAYGPTDGDAEVALTIDCLFEPVDYADLRPGHLFLCPFGRGSVLAMRAEDEEQVFDLILAERGETGLHSEDGAPYPVSAGALGRDVFKVSSDGLIKPSYGEESPDLPIFVDQAVHSCLAVSGGQAWVAFRRPPVPGVIWVNLITGRLERPPHGRAFFVEWDIRVVDGQHVVAVLARFPVPGR